MPEIVICFMIVKEGRLTNVNINEIVNFIFRKKDLSPSQVENLLQTFLKVKQLIKPNMSIAKVI